MFWSIKKKKSTVTKTKGTPNGTTRPRRQITKSQLSKTDYKKWLTPETKSITFPSSIYADSASYYKTFLDALVRHIPSVSAAVWVWENLCSTRQHVKLIGGQDKDRTAAQQSINDLSKNISPFPFAHKAGTDSLFKLFFHSIFARGRFAAQMILDPNLSGVASIKILDPFKIKFKKNSYLPFYQRQSEFVSLNPLTTFYHGLNMSADNPYGYSMSETAWPFIKIADELLEDMRVSSANAGIPRMHIKITQPEQAPDEDHEDYVSRISTYFSDTVSQFTDLAADDNIYSWDDVKIEIAGAQGPAAFVWKSNRSILDEEIISAFHLYPWAIGKSTGTTKNWVMSQFDLLMSQIESVQLAAKRFSEWILNTHLALQGLSQVNAEQHFTLVRDPAIKEMAIAERFKISNVKTKVLAGWISSDDGARELGYDKAFDADRIYRMQKEKEEPINKEDNSPDSNLLSLTGPPDVAELTDQFQIINDKLDDILNKASPHDNIFTTNRRTG